MIAGACLKLWSSTQAFLALSSGEAEYYAALKGASHGLGLQSMLADLGISTEVHRSTDSAAAKGLVNSRGLGKTRHVEVCDLWLQSKVDRQEVTIHKVSGESSSADLFTKYLP